MAVTAELPFTPFTSSRSPHARKSSSGSAKTVRIRAAFNRAARLYRLAVRSPMTSTAGHRRRSRAVTSFACATSFARSRPTPPRPGSGRLRITGVAAADRPVRSRARFARSRIRIEQRIAA